MGFRRWFRRLLITVRGRGQRVPAPSRRRTRPGQIFPEPKIPRDAMTAEGEVDAVGMMPCPHVRALGVGDSLTRGRRMPVSPTDVVRSSARRWQGGQRTRFVSPKGGTLEASHRQLMPSTQYLLLMRVFSPRHSRPHMTCNPERAARGVDRILRVCDGEVVSSEQLIQVSKVALDDAAHRGAVELKHTSKKTLFNSIMATGFPRH